MVHSIWYVVYTLGDWSHVGESLEQGAGRGGGENAVEMRRKCRTLGACRVCAVWFGVVAGFLSGRCGANAFRSAWCRQGLRSLIVQLDGSFITVQVNGSKNEGDRQRPYLSLCYSRLKTWAPNNSCLLACGLSTVPWQTSRSSKCNMWRLRKHRQWPDLCCWNTYECTVGSKSILCTRYLDTWATEKLWLQFPHDHWTNPRSSKTLLIKDGSVNQN